MQTELRHSGIGISAFVLSLVAGLVLLVTVFIAGYMQATTPGGVDERAASTVLTGLMLMLGILMALIAGGLGLAGTFQKTRRRLFAVLGTVLSAAQLLLVTGLMFIGLLARAS